MYKKNEDIVQEQFQKVVAGMMGEFRNSGLGQMETLEVLSAMPELLEVVQKHHRENVYSPEQLTMLKNLFIKIIDGAIAVTPKQSMSSSTSSDIASLLAELAAEQECECWGSNGNKKNASIEELLAPGVLKLEVSGPNPGLVTSIRLNGIELSQDDFWHPAFQEIVQKSELSKRFAANGTKVRLPQVRS